MTTMLLIRHAESAWSAQRRWTGWADPPLSEAGRRDATTWARAHSASILEFDVIVSSDLERSRETAAILAATFGVPLHHEMTQLREQDSGAWTGLTKDQVRRRWPDLLRRTPREPLDGESASELLARVEEGLTLLTGDFAHARVLVVTHTGVIRELERAHGAPRSPIPHLEGRWISTHASSRGLSVVLGALSSGRPMATAT